MRKAAKDCDFGTDTDNQIRDAVLNKCTSTDIKRKLLEEGQGLNLTCTLEVAAKCEKIETQLAALSVKGKNQKVSIESTRDVTIRVLTSTQGRFQGRDKICYKCGLFGHLGHDPQCPARGKTCRKCRGKDHFEKVCKIKSYAHQVGREPDDNDPGPQHDYVFSIAEGEHSEMVTVRVG